MAARPYASAQDEELSPAEAAKLVAKPLLHVEAQRRCAGRTRQWWTKVSDFLLAIAALATVWFAFSEHMVTLGLKY